MSAARGCGVVVVSVLAACGLLRAAVLEVGPHRAYASPNEAYAAALPGDTVVVYPREANAPYEQVHIYATKARIAIIARQTGGQRVALSGDGYTYSGAGSTPRAMFQFNRGADDCLVEGFKISGCRNTTYNGAAIRINQANRITVRDCEIHGNDMGLMSNGSVADSTGADQLIENCVVHGNGNLSYPGYNHNFYMGATSVVIRGCDVYGATTGHNIKSRAHLTIIEACFIHDSPNREIDLVDDAVNTSVAGSHALISGCVIVKKNNSTGNRGVIHFGQDGGNAHNGTLYLLHSTILTPYGTPVTTVSAAQAGVRYYNCLISDPGRGQTSGQTLIALNTGALAENSGGAQLWVSRAFSAGAGVSITAMSVGDATTYPDFIAPATGDLTLSEPIDGIVDAAAPIASFAIPAILSARQLPRYVPPLGWAPRTFVREPDIGAFEWIDTGGVRQGRPSPPAQVRRHPAAGVVSDLRGRNSGNPPDGGAARVVAGGAHTRVVLH